MAQNYLKTDWRKYYYVRRVKEFACVHTRKRIVFLTPGQELEAWQNRNIEQLRNIGFQVQLTPAELFPV